MQISEALGPEAHGADSQFVTFSVANETFAVPMAPVQEIIRLPEVAKLPLAPASLDGLANLRGRVLPIVNLRRIFGVPERDSDDATRAVVINLGQPLGFVVDKVRSVISIEPGQLESARHIQSVVQADYLTGVIKRSVPDQPDQELLLVLDFERIVREQFAMLARAGSGRAGTASSGHLDMGTAQTDANTAGTDDFRLVSFTVASQEYAIDIADVREIVQRPAVISELPNTPPYVMGLMTLRERLLPLVGLRNLFGLPDLDRTDSQRIVVVSVPGSGQIGLVTDSVKEVLSVPRSQAEDVPAILAGSKQMHEFSSICRLDDGKRLVSVIASARLPGLSELAHSVAALDANAVPAESHLDQPNAKEFNMEARNVVTAAVTDDDIQVVIFRLDGEEYGVPIMNVQEIVRVPESLTRVPRTPVYAEGVINLRGTVLPVIDQRTQLGLPRSERNDRQRIMVYTLGAARTGFIVDSVAEVLRISRNQIEVAPELSPEQAQLIKSVAKLDGDKRLVLLIDPAQLLGPQAIAQPASANPLVNAPAGIEPIPFALAA